MKARIKETGEVFRVDWVQLENGYNYELQDVELIFEGSFSKLPIDYEQRRFDLVVAALQGLCANPNIDFKRTTFEVYAKDAIKHADAVLAEYRKGGEE